MIEMQDVDRIQTFLDEQSSQPMVAELEAEIAEEEEEERKLSKGEVEIEREKDEQRRRELHSMADADSSTTAAPSAISSPANRHRPFPSAFASKDRRGRGSKRVRLRISTVVTQSKMRLVHVSWYVMAVGLTWAASLALWVAALCYTSTARASLFSSTYPLILLVWMRWKGVQVSWLETVGVVVALVGIVTAESSATSPARSASCPWTCRCPRRPRPRPLQAGCWRRCRRRARWWRAAARSWWAT